MRAHRGDDFDALVAFAQEKKIDFVVIAPDNPLVGGLWDRFEAAGIRASGLAWRAPSWKAPRVS